MCVYIRGFSSSQGARMRLVTLAFFVCGTTRGVSLSISAAGERERERESRACGNFASFGERERTSGEGVEGRDYRESKFDVCSAAALSEIRWKTWLRRNLHLSRERERADT